MNLREVDFRNTYGNNTAYLTHGIHSYTARLIPQIPRHFIKKYSKKNEIIFDPFCGSGTSLLEAKLLERNAIGIDINPLARLISEVKTTKLNLEKLKRVFKIIKNDLKNNDKRIPKADFFNIDYWFSEKSKHELSRIKFVIENFNGRVDKKIYNFLLLCFSSVIRKSSNADPRMAKTYHSKRVKEKIKKGWIAEPINYFEENFEKNLQRIISLSEIINSNKNFVKVFQGDVRDSSLVLKKNKIKKIDFIITSPPYINAQDYFRSYKLELYWLDFATQESIRKLNKKTIGTERTSQISKNGIPKSGIFLLDRILRRIYKLNIQKSYIVYNYFSNMSDVLGEFYSILRKGGHLCLIMGTNTICEMRIPTYKIMIDIAEELGFKLVEIVKDKIENRSLPPKRNHNGGMIKEEWITVFQKKI